jgi:hypothetical protein
LEWERFRKDNDTLDINEIKEYCEHQLARSERISVAAERTASYWEDQAALRSLWIQASIAESLASIAANLDTFRVAGLPIENVGGH